MTHRRFFRALLLSLALVASVSASAGDITNASLEIQGIGLSVETTEPVTTPLDVPTTVQTSFGGKMNDAALAIEGLLAVGDLTGPGLDAPLELSTAPGHKFEIPGLSREGTYTLQNVRLMKGRELLQYASPSSATILVADLFKTAVEVRQLTPEEIRARGIVIDARNYEVYEYTLSFFIRGQEVKIPFPVIVDPRTRSIVEMPIIDPYKLPPISTIGVGRFTPPDVIPVQFEDDQLPPEENPTPKEPKDPEEVYKPRPPIPAAIVIPNSLAVMHQFFAVVLTVTNGSPDGSTARLENLTARIKVPTQLRTASTTPPVALGQAVPIVDKEHGVTFLVAQAKGEAEWSVEALKPGTHTIEIELKGTLKENGQDDIPLVARPRASVVVHDTRFNIAFSHPDTVRKGIEYTTYSFVTNTSPSMQTIRLANSVPPCETAGNANACRIGGGLTDEITIPSGETRTVQYRMRSGITGKVFATAAHIDSENAVATAQLHMGVSDTGIPLSPTTLIMPHYAQYVNPTVVDEYLKILGLGYSIATAPATSVTAKLPRVIKSDVYRRAVDIAQAGQAIFLANDAPGSKRDALVSLALDLLGNQAELSQWDALRRQEKYARPADAAVISELAAAGLANGTTFETFVDDFAKAASHRDGFVAALVHGPAVAGNERPYALSLRGVSSGRRIDIPNEAASGWVRDLPYADLSRISSETLGRAGELALVGRWSTEDLEVVVTPSVDGPFRIELLYPNATDGSTMRAHLELTGVAGQTIKVPLSRGLASVTAQQASGAFVSSANSSVVPLETLRVVGIRQDLYLDENGHKLSVLFNRPVAAGVPAANLREKFHGEIDFNKDGVVWMDEPRPISAAALQPSGRVIDLTFDHVLHINAPYTVEIDPLLDPRTNAAASFPGEFVPKIDNDVPAGIIYGKFVKGDNTPLADHEIYLFSGVPNPEIGGALFIELDQPRRRVPANPYFQPPQIMNTRADGSYLFEYVRRDFEGDFSGSFRLFGHADNMTKYTHVDGTIRLPGRVHFVNLQLLGRGSAEGYVRYDNGEPVKGASVTVGSTVFEGVRNATTNDQGFYRVEDLPVGPLAFTARDASGNIGYAAGEVATPGEIEQQDISIYRQPVPKNGRVHGRITRSDNGAAVAGATIGIFNNGYPILSLTTDSDGRFNAETVPAGFISVVAAEWTVSRLQAATDFDLRGDEVREVNLTLSVTPAEQTTTITGTVFRDDPAFPGDASKFQRVVGALVKVYGMRIVTTDENGRFEIRNVPISLVSGTKIGAYDPVSKQIEDVELPQLTVAGPNDIPILVRGYGKGSLRAKLLDAKGQPVDGVEMLVKAGGGYYAMAGLGGGVYQLDKMAAGGEYIIRTGTIGAGPYKHQEASSNPVRIAYAGQMPSVTLRLPGKGEVRARVKGISIPNDGGEPILTSLITDVTLSYKFFNSATFTTDTEEITVSTNQGGLPGDAAFPGIPALRDYAVTSEHPLGHSSAGGRLAFEGDFADHTLTLSNLGYIRGVVYAIDGVTPVPGASVRMEDGHQDQGIVTTGLDGKFEFRNVAPGALFHLTAESTQSGIYRIAERYGNIPDNGGIINTSLTLLQRGQVEGRIVYAGYKVYDPLHPENNVVDNTPNDPSDNAPVPLARFYMRELDFPRRALGTSAQPLSADLAGRFAMDNVFVGRLRATAWSPENLDLRGEWTDTLTQEGQLLTPYIVVGGAGGTGAVEATVTNPNQMNAPVINAEVYLYRGGGGLFDVASTDANGKVRFEQLPVGTYVVTAYSKALGKSGRGDTDAIVTTDGVAQVRVMLTFSGEVTGRLTDPESSPANAPIPGSHVTISMAEGFQQRFTTTALGEYIFEGVREGSFSLDAKDTASNRRAHATGYLSAADPEPVVNLELEPTETLYVAVYQPDDFGARSNTLAGPVDITVSQRGGEFYRSMQGNPIVMPKLFRNGGSYDVTIQEIGGAQRQLFYRGAFPSGSASQPIQLYYPAYGNLEVLVRRAGAPVPDARVAVRVSKHDTRIFYSDATGRILATGLPLNSDFGIVATVLDGSSGATNARVLRQSVLATATVEVGSRAVVKGSVIAEAGGPSAGTPVVIRFSGGQLLGTTDDFGQFTFAGVAVPSGIELLYYGPDGTTLGATQNFSLGAEWGGREYTSAAVRIDATAPLLLDIVPAGGANNVPPDTHLKFVFSEPIAAGAINNGNFVLQPADGSPAVNATFTATQASNGNYIVTMKPPAPPAGQLYPLKSNTLYRLIVNGNITDLTGHPLGANRGQTFTTADYVEPRVVARTPAAGYPIPEQITYEFRFNEPLDPAPFLPGGDGIFQLSRMSGPEETATVLENVAGNAYVHPVTGISLFFAPSSVTKPNSYYRVKFSGVRDLQGNVVPEQTYRYESWDTFKPFVILRSPVPGGLPLASALTYKLTPEIRNESAGGTLATDIDVVEWFRVDNGVETFLKSAKTEPFAYDFVAPDAPPAGLPLTFRAKARDKSTNESVPVDLTLVITPNLPPTVAVALDRTTDVYPGERVNATVTLSDEVVEINLQLDVKATKTDNTEYRKVYPLNVKRNSIADPWPSPSFAVDLPSNLKGGTTVTFTGIATDMSGLSSSSTTPITLAVDTIKPVIVSSTPDAWTEYAFGQKYKLSANVTDVGTGVSEVRFGVDGQTYTVLRSAAVGTTYTSPLISVTAHSTNTTMPVTVTAVDNNGNVETSTFNIVYLAVNDPTVPSGEWLCPISGAALPASTNGLPLTLRLRASDDVSVTSVQFKMPDGTLLDPTLESPGVYVKAININTPAAGTPDYVITAIVKDADPAHTQEYRVRLTFVAVDYTINSTQAILANDIPTYQDKSVVVRGAQGRLVPHVAVQLKNLIVIEGGRVDTLATTTSTERKLDLTVTDNFYVDCASSVDVSGRGYLGAFGANQDGSNTRNESDAGRTLGNTIAGGAKSAGGSHAGIGDFRSDGLANDAYGSYAEPRTLGAGGGGSSAAGSGGGAVAVTSTNAKFIIAGSVRADGAAGNNNSNVGGGAGGSVLLKAADVVIGPLARVTANGGDSVSGGGGRIAIHATSSLSFPDNNVQAHGGRNANGEAATNLDGGAGTIYIVRPGETEGELRVSAFDDRYPTTVHPAQYTPVSAADPELVFRTITAGPHAVVRFDQPYRATQTDGVTVDATAKIVGPDVVPTVSFTTNPPADSTVWQNAPIAVTYNAASDDGIAEARVSLPGGADVFERLNTFPAATGPRSLVIKIPSNATPGSITLTVRVTSRTGRTFQTTAAYTIAADAGPTVTFDSVVPATEIYAGGTINVAGSASDDVEVKSLELSSSPGTVSSQAATKPTPTTMARQFSVALAKNLPSASSVVLTLAASDGFPNRAPSTVQQTLTIKRDEIPPVVSFTKPTANQQFNEAANGTFTIEVLATDAEVGVNTVKATFEGTQYTLAPVSGQPGKYSVSGVPIPNVDGSEPVAKTITVSVTDFEPNTTTQTIAIYIVPLLDPNAPKNMAWLCSSPNAMYPAGVAVPIKVYAEPTSAQNGVQRVEITVDGGAPTTLTSAGSNQYTGTINIPAATAAGTVFNIRVAAFSTSGAEASLLGTFTVVAGEDITSPRFITETDFSLDNKTIVVRSGGAFNVTGVHSFKNIIVLDGGKLVQHHLDLGRGEGSLTVDRLYVACNGSVDVSALGYNFNATYPGAAMSDDGSGGSHIGRGGVWNRLSGGVFGSVYEPLQAGASGNMPDGATAAGGGIVHITGRDGLTIDGAVRANGTKRDWAGGAGGSIWLSTPGVLNGGGTIEANGSTANNGAGGGGAVLLEYASTSGSIATNAFARGATTNLEGRHSAAGTVLRRGGGAVDLTIDNGTIPTFSATELPSFGRATVRSAASGTIVLDDRRYLSPSLVGNRVRALAPNGTTRGTYRLSSVTNPTASFTLPFYAEIKTQDAVAYDGYLMYSTNGLGVEKRKLAAIRKNGAQWQYDNDVAFVAFTPSSTDYVFASFSKNAANITRLTQYRCAATCGTVDGLQIIEVIAGEISSDNASWTIASGPQSGLFTYDPSEFYLRGDGGRRAFTLSAGNASIKLESLDGTPVSLVQPGDTLRGVYVLDSLKLTGARVVTEDLVETATALQKDAASSLTSGNPAAPAFNASAVSVQYGLRGPIVVGTAGAISDPDQPLEVVARNTNGTAAAPPDMPRIDHYFGFGTNGGRSVYHIDNNRTGSSSGNTIEPIGTTGYMAFVPSQNNRAVQVGLTPTQSMTGYGEPGMNSFRLRTDGVYEIWANNANTGKTGAYAANTAFRMERRPASLRWIVDDVIVHEVTSNLPAALTLDVSFDLTALGEIGSLEYSTTEVPRNVFHAKVAADGSFRVPIFGNPGDPIVIKSRDRHAYSLESSEIAVGTIPNNLGVASITFPSAELVGGRSVTGTVTLLAAAGNEGAIVELTSNNAALTVPATATVAAGAISGTFNATTTPVTVPTDVVVSGSYAGFGANGALRIIKDTVAPAVTITQPAANTQFNEGSANKIALRATIVDDDSGVKSAKANIDGKSYDLTKDAAANVWKADVPVPFVDGTTNVTKDLTVTALDNLDNSATSAAVPVVIKPVVDANPPTVSWSCSGLDALYPVGYSAKLRVTAKAPNATNYLHKVEFIVTDPGNASTTYLATSPSADLYEYDLVVPDAPDGSLYNVRALVTTASGTTAETLGSFTVLKGASEITANAAISATTTTYENKTVVVRGGTTTIDGAHTFARLVVLNGGTITHTSGGANRVDVQAANVFVECGGKIDVIGRGYPQQQTYLGAIPANGSKGGSHIGRGANGDTGSTFGSIASPLEAGGGGYAGAGGGVIRIKSTSIVIDGSVQANGTTNGGGGGSVWITTQRVRGAGALEARGAAAASFASYAGGGGVVAVEYTDASSVVPTIRVWGGDGDGCCSGIYLEGAPGAVFIRGPQSTYGDVTISSHDTQSRPAVELPSLGKGAAAPGSSGATLITDRTADIPAYFVGHWVEITRGGTLKGTYRISGVTAKTATLEANGADAPAVAEGDQWQGVYRFDNVTTSTIALVSSDPIRAGKQEIGSNTTRLDSVSARDLVVKGTLTPYLTSTLTIDATNEVRVDSGGLIDVVGYGWPQQQTNPNAVPANGSTGGSHIGRGANAGIGATFGSIYRPRESGGGGYAGSSGGVIRITAPNVVVNGTVRATGSPNGGAGGSVWITTQRITGTGVVDASGADAASFASYAGGGGVVALEYSDATSVLPSLRSWGGNGDGCCSGIYLEGAPGAVYVKGPGSTYGDLQVISADTQSRPATDLPSLGSGTAQAGSTGATLVTHLTSIPPYFAGHWVEVWNAAGTQKGTYRVDSISGGTLTLAPATGETISVQPGDVWYGVYRADTFKQRSITVLSADKVVYTTLDKDSSTFNNGAPRFDGTKVQSIVLESDATGHYVRGAIGTVVDNDKPVVMTATNKRSGTTYTANAANDGSFTVKVDGIENDLFTLYATDVHGLRSRTLDVNGALGANSVTSVTVSPTSVGGGVNATGTVTLALPAGTSGVVVNLSSSSSYAVVPATLSIASGALSKQFTITTTEPPANVDAIITASFGASTRTATLTVTRDTTGPTVTVTAPAANTQYNEGSANLINVRATVADDFSGIKRVYATLSGATTDLTKDNSQPNLYVGNVPAPFIDGSENVTLDLTVTGIDGRDNATISAPVPVIIKPVVDPNAPTVAWSCSSDAMYPVGYTANLRVIAKAPNAQNYVAKVEVTVTNPQGTPTTLIASPVSGVTDGWEAAFLVPDVADGSLYTTRAVVTTASGTAAQVTGSLTVIKGGVEITGNTTIADGNVSFDNKSLILRSGTTTIAGKHTFVRVAVLDTARIEHAQGGLLDIAATGIYVACGASIDTTGKGYINTASYPGETTAGSDATGGSHIGRGGWWGDRYGTTYGSVYRPQEAGAASGSGPSGAGGGIVRIQASAVSVDGAIRANGSVTDRSGAGGSVWITTGRISGAGAIETNGGQGFYGIGAGGALAIEYTDPTSTLPTLSSRSGPNKSGGNSRYGGAGSIYVKGPSSTYGDLTIDNGGVFYDWTILPSFGKGTAQAGTSGATLVTNRSANIPAYFGGHWVEIYAPDGTLKGTWRIATIPGAAKTVTLQPNSGETIDVQAGDTWQGVYRFDNYKTVGMHVDSADPIRVSGTQTIEGLVETPQITAATLVVKGTLTHLQGQSLTIKAGEVRVETGALIDVTGKGYINTGSYPGETTAGSDATGGSHIGRGGWWGDRYGTTYGSVYRPQEAGAASGSGPSGAGGGIVRIDAPIVVVNGTIRANGSVSDRSGAGGSVWITTGRISGAGAIETNGGQGFYGIGAGGALAIEYTDPTSTLPTLSSRSGPNKSGGNSRYGGAGSIYIKGASSTYGDLTIDASTFRYDATILPSLGAGGTLAGTGGAVLVTNRAANVPAYFIGHWVEVRDASGVLKGTWRISAINGKTITLAPNLTETIDVQPGDAWQGVYRFDNVKLRAVSVLSGDPIRSTNAIDATGTTVDINDGPPFFATAKRAQIVVDSALTGDAVIGPAGAVTDANLPIKLTVTNNRTSAAITANANGDGSFRIPVTAAAGDTFRIYATDSHTVPSSSGELAVNGAIVELNGVASLTISPTTVVSGTNATGTVQLLSPARTTGTVVSLSSSDAAAVVAATITIPNGATSAQFPITAPVSASGTTVTITASTGIAAKSASLNVLASGAYNTTITGRVLDERSRAVPSLTVTCGPRTATTATDGFFSITGVPASGNITCTATQSLPDGTTYSGTSSPTPAVADGITNVGDIVLRTTITFTQINSSTWGVGTSFRARTIKRDGKTLLVTGAGGGSGTGDSDRIAVYDLSNPASPTFVRQVSAGNTAIYDAEIVDGWAYIGSYSFCTINLASTTSAKVCTGTIGALSVAVMNRYAFVSTNSNYNISIYDVTDPGAHRLLRTQGMIPSAGAQKFFWDLIPLGNNYLAGLSFTSESVGHDLMIMDARDVNNLIKVVDLDIPNFLATRGSLVGSILYLASSTGEVAAIDVSNPASPVILSRTLVSGGSDNVTVVGNEAFAAAGTNGLALLDVTLPASPFNVKNITVGGTTRDVVFYSNYAYVANDTGLAYARMPIAPQVSSAKITLARATPNVTVTGAATAVTGATPITVSITNRTTGAVAPNFAVAADGSFSASIAASPGDAISVTAFDVANRSSNAIDAGTVPFATSSASYLLNPASSYRARTVATDGTWLTVAKWGEEADSGGVSTKLAVFDITNPQAPVYKWSLDGALGSSYDIDVVDGRAYLGGYDFCTIDLRSSTSSRACVSLGAADIGVAVDGGYAFVTGNWQLNDGRIRIYNVSNPGSPTLVREQSTTATTEFSDIMVYGSNYLVAVAGAHDVVVFDRTNINNLVKLADIDIPDFWAFRGQIDGNLLVLSSYDDKIAVVDLTTPASPAVRKVLSTGVYNHGATLSGNLAVFAGAMGGALFVDVTNPSAPVILGRQATSGNAWDVLLRNGVLYVANEQGLVTLAGTTLTSAWSPLIASVSAPPNDKFDFATAYRGVAMR